VDHARLSGHPGVARVLVVTEAYKPLIQYGLVARRLRKCLKPSVSESRSALKW
jgi:hypothetical protein